jgi:hypothetical protein
MREQSVVQIKKSDAHSKNSCSYQCPARVSGQLKSLDIWNVAAAWPENQESWLLPSPQSAPLAGRAASGSPCLRLIQRLIFLDNTDEPRVDVNALTTLNQ